MLVLITVVVHHYFQALTGELSPFMCSAAHLNQMDRHPSTVGAFLEGVVKCKPQPHIRSCILKVHNYVMLYLIGIICLRNIEEKKVIIILLVFHTHYRCESIYLSLSLSLSPPPSLLLLSLVPW